MGSPTGALRCQAEDSIPQKSLREPGALHGGVTWWGPARTSSLRTGCSGRGQVVTSTKCRDIGFGSGSQRMTLSDLILEKSILAAVCRTGWRGKTGGRDTRQDTIADLV